LNLECIVSYIIVDYKNCLESFRKIFLQNKRKKKKEKEKKEWEGVCVLIYKCDDLWESKIIQSITIVILVIIGIFDLGKNEKNIE